MQYPIIDLMTDAYLNNGWTGLTVILGKNLWDSSMTYSFGYISSTGEEVYSPGGKYTNEYTEVNPNTTYTWSFDGPVSSSVLFSISAYDQNKNFIGRITGGYPSDFPVTFTTPNNTKYLRFSVGLIIPDFQLEIGNTATPYEPYSDPKNDFPNRLKLPLPRYFPHPVIDALQRAAAGTQTADDTEILRHYLTPLGIGGI